MVPVYNQADIIRKIGPINDDMYLLFLRNRKDWRSIQMVAEDPLYFTSAVPTALYDLIYGLSSKNPVPKPYK